MLIEKSKSWKAVSLKLTAALATMALFITVMSVAFAGGMGHVHIKTNPPGAKVIVGGQVVGTTPLKLELPADNKVRIQIKKDGYRTKSFSLTPKDGRAKTVTVKLKK